MADQKREQTPPKDISITVEFTGGLELLFGGRRKMEISLPRHASSGQHSNIDFLVQYLCENFMTDKRTDMFVTNGTVRPGVLVLINDADWELEGEGQYVLKPRDNVMFVSTLHGG